MKILLQRVMHAEVSVDRVVKGAIARGLLVFIGIENADNETDVEWLSNKIINMRLFNDEHGIPNISVKDIQGDILLISQFTLQADTKKGNRPSYIKASKPPVALPLYEAMIKSLEKNLGKKIATGVFGADMQVSLVNDGPVTILIDSKNK